jgi:Fe-S oxidoreductase
MPRRLPKREVDDPMSRIEHFLFILFLAAGVAAFGVSLVRLIRLMLLGRKDGRLAGTLFRRFWSMIDYAFLQARVVQAAYGWVHFLMFWSFLILLLSNLEFLLSGVIPGFKFWDLMPNGALGPLYMVFDIVSALMVLVMVVAAFRRIVLRPKHIDAMSPEALLIISLIMGLMLAYFGLQGTEIALGISKTSGVLPVSALVSAWCFKGLPHAGLVVLTKVFWWAHAVILIGFLNYLPRSKHMHILAAIPNCFCRSFEPVRTVEREKFAEGFLNGVSRVDQFTWKDILDFMACTECGRCNKNCPATITGKPLNPRVIIHQGKMNLMNNGDAILKNRTAEPGYPLITEEVDTLTGVAEPALWACTTCGACMQRCPVFIEHVPKIVKMRRDLVENRAKFPAELSVLFEAIEQRFNPWGVAPNERTKWSAELELTKFTKESGCEYLLYTGCAGALDSRIKSVAVALVKSLKAAGVSFGILGSDEKCCGDSLRKLGNEFVFEKAAIANIEQFSALGVKKIITLCPHCLSILRNDYKQFGFEAEVYHHSEFLQKLVSEGKLKLKAGTQWGRTVYHDPCYLGRYQGVFKEPRLLIEGATGNAPIEMDRNRTKSFCCGAGGGRMWMEEDPADRININRVKESLDRNPDTVAVSCPYCLTMFADGLKDLKQADKVKVRDIAEIVAESV